MTAQHPAAHPAADLFPMMTVDELDSLADNIRDHGLIEPVWLYDDPDMGKVVLDGRNRLRACEMAGVQPATRMYNGDDPIGFAISQNLTRRHLTAGQKAAVANDSLPLYEAEARRKMAEAAAAEQRRRAEQQAKAAAADPNRHYEQGGADRPHPAPDPAPVDVKTPAAAAPPPHEAEPEHQQANGAEETVNRAPRARDKAAKVTGTSGRSVARFKRISDQAPDLAAKVRAGDMPLDRAERVIRDREAEARKIEQARREAEAQPQPATVDIRHGDFRQVLADLENVDAIITDPPYPAEFLPLLGDLASWADKVLAPDGVLAVLIGQTHLPEVYRLLDGGRPYRWTCAYLTSGPGYVSHPRRIQSNWKPLLIYGGGPRIADVLRSEGTDANAKTLHKWGQDYSAFHTLVERLTVRGATVADPFMGSGTTLLAAHALGRHTVGADIDPAHVATAQERLS